MEVSEPDREFVRIHLPGNASRIHAVDLETDRRDAPGISTRFTTDDAAVTAAAKVCQKPFTQCTFVPGDGIESSDNPVSRIVRG